MCVDTESALDTLATQSDADRKLSRAGKLKLLTSWSRRFELDDKERNALSLASPKSPGLNTVNEYHSICHLLSCLDGEATERRL